MAIAELLVVGLLLSTFDGTYCKDSTVTGTFTCLPRPESIPPKDCSELPAGSVSGVYTIKSTGSHPYTVFCDMDTDGGGWTVFQRRQDGTVNFYLNWTDYEVGFGSVSGEHWLGNAKIAKLTEQKNYSLRVDMKDFEGSSKRAVYDTFRVIANEDYTLVIEGYEGNSGNAMDICNGQRFSTNDRDNDRKATNCAVEHEGAWWYKGCHKANLNGRYIPGGVYNSTNGPFYGIEWEPWKGRGYSLAFTEMKLRRKD